MNLVIELKFVIGSRVQVIGLRLESEYILRRNVLK